MHKNVGFVEERYFQKQHSNGEKRIDVIRFVMLASDWAKNRQMLETSILELDVQAY